MLAAIAVLCLAAYWPALQGSFLLDDRPNIVENPYIQIDKLDAEALRAVIGAPGAGPLGRPLAYLSFAINHAAFGMSAWHFKLVNLLLHVLTGAAFYGLLRGLLATKTKQQKDSLSWLCVFAAGVWLLHPWHVSTVAYVVQRMAQLAALFMALGLASYVAGRLRLEAGCHKSGLLLWLISLLCVPLAALSKENGLLLIPLLVAAEVLIFRGRWHSRPVQLYWRLGLSAALAGALLVAINLWPEISHRIESSYARRDFSLGERVLTQFRVIWLYILQWVVPDIRMMTLFRDGIPLSRDILSPWTTLVAACATAGLLLSAVLLWRRHPLYTFGIAVFFVGHSIESSVYGIELMFEHRNYFPSMGLMVAATPLLAAIPQHAQGLRRLMPVAAATVLLLLSISTLSRNARFADYWSLLEHTTTHHAQSARGQNWAGITYQWGLNEPVSANDPVLHRALYHFQRAAELNPQASDPLLRSLWLQARYRGEINPALLDQLLQRLQNQPITPETTHALQEWVLNAISVPGPISPALGSQVIRAALGNPQLGRSRDRAIIEWAAGRFFADVTGNLDLAIGHLETARELLPDDLAISISLAELLTRRGDCTAARAAIQSGVAASRLPVRADAIAAQRQIIENRCPGISPSTIRP